MANKLSHLTETELAALEEFKELLKKKLREEVLDIKLFGSKARGDYNKESDIDILIILKQINEKKKDKVFGIVTEILHKYNFYLSVHIYSLKEFKRLNSVPTVFMQFIQQEAIAI